MYGLIFMFISLTQKALVHIRVIELAADGTQTARGPQSVIAARGVLGGTLGRHAAHRVIRHAH